MVDARNRARGLARDSGQKERPAAAVNRIPATHGRGRGGDGSEAVERHPPQDGDERDGEREEAEAERDDFDNGRRTHG